MLKRKSTLGKGNRSRRPIERIPIPSSAVKHRLGSGLFSKQGMKQRIANQKGRPINFTPVSNSTPEDKSQVCELRNAANFNTGVKRSLFPRNKENVGPKYHSGSVQGVTASCSKSVSSWKTPGSYIVKIPDPPQLLMSGSSKMPKTFINKVDKLEDFDIQHTRTTFFKMTKPVTRSSKTFNNPYIPLLLRSTSSRRFMCVTNPDTPRVAKMSPEEEKQDIASIIVARALFNDNSNTSTTNSSRISRAPPVICTSSNKDSQAMHRDKISHGGIQDCQNSPEIKSVASVSLTRAFPKTSKIDVNDRLSNISERTETLKNQLEFHSKINVPLIVTQCCSVDYVDPQSSGCFDLAQAPTHLRYMNSRPSTSVVKSTSKLPRFVRREGNLEKEEKNDSDVSENRTILTAKQISTKDSLSKLKSYDENKSFSESMIMTRSKRKKSLEASVTLHSDKRFCSTDSGILKINEPEKTETSHSSEVLFCSSKGAQTRNKLYSSTDYPLQQNSFVSKTYPDNLPISCRNISETKATQTSPFRVLTENKSIVETVMATHDNDSVYVKKELLLKLKKQLFEMNNQIDGILSGFIVGATELQNSDFSNEKNKSSAKRTPIRRSQRIAARMSNSLPFVSPGTLPVDEYNAKSCSLTSELNKSLHMYKELKTDFKFLRTPKRSNKKTPMKSPGTFLSDRVQDQLKLLFD